ncbi:MAG: hypothetical protein CL900_02785 [Dehalococcoidia bacterium]|nr:hypothetical protein [Dehalococcoidia bacterium]
MLAILASTVASISSVLMPQPTNRSINPAEKRITLFLEIANIRQSISCFSIVEWSGPMVGTIVDWDFAPLVCA